MQPNAIVYPAIAMFFFTFSVIVYVAYRRVTAVQRGEVSIRYYRLFNEGEQPEALERLGRHVQNHFEVPPLFYAAVILLYVTGGVTPVSVGLAWLFVALRGLHGWIHLSSNDVRSRLQAWAGGVLAVAGLWLCLLLHLIG